MKKLFDLQWFKTTPIDFVGDQMDWNRTLITKINQARAQMSIACKDDVVNHKSLIISENCRSLIATLTLQSEYFHIADWNRILFVPVLNNLIQVVYDKTYTDINLID